jgi:hypothetical protein
LPVGVTGGSGLDALGTVATGNISNTAIVKPTGTMVLIGNKAITAASGSTTSTSYVATGLGTASRDMDITIAAATVALYSKIIVVFNHMLNVNQATFALADTKVYRNGSAWSLRHIVGQATSSHSNANSITRVVIDTSLPGSGDVTYSYRVRKHQAQSSYSGAINVLGAEVDTGAYVVAYGCI